MENVREIAKGRNIGAIVAIVIAAMTAMPALALISSTSAKVDVKLAFVDIGENDADVALLTGWGPVEPDTSGGNWGGYGTSGEDTRVIWYDDIDGEDDPNGREGEIQIFFSGSARWLTYEHLDGLADDSFELYAQGEVGWVLIDSYVDSGAATGEVWIEETVDLTGFMSCDECEIYLGGGEFSLLFVATGDSWSGWSTYGQVAIDYITIYGNGNPLPE